jgi:DNA repair exonuclease SbcCD ATPase subunit
MIAIEADKKLKFFIDSKGTLEQEIYELRFKLKDQEKAAELKAEMNKKEKEIQSLEEKINVVPDFNRDEFLLIQSELTKTNDALKIVEVAQARKDTELLYINKELLKLKEELKEYKELYNNLANYRLLYQAYNDIPSLLFELAVPTIETYTNEILARIFPAERVELRSFRETKSNTLQKTLDVVGTTSTGQRDFNDLSGSEKLRQSLALRIALARYVKECNQLDIGFMVIDEGGFGALDEDNLQPMKAMLADVAKMFDQFVIITHMDELKDCLETQIVVNPTGKGEKLTVIGGN